jgi:hypothetical protein
MRGYLLRLGLQGGKFATLATLLAPALLRFLRNSFGWLFFLRTGLVCGYLLGYSL